MPRLRAVLALGGTAHNAVLRANGLKPARVPFRHGAMHALPEERLLVDSYHVSRLNTKHRAAHGGDVPRRRWQHARPIGAATSLTAILGWRASRPNAHVGGIKQKEPTDGLSASPVCRSKPFIPFFA